MVPGLGRSAGAPQDRQQLETVNTHTFPPEGPFAILLSSKRVLCRMSHYTRSLRDEFLVSHCTTCSPRSFDRERRVELGWTQADLASLSGVPQADISRIENARLDARWSTIHADGLRPNTGADSPSQGPQDLGLPSSRQLDSDTSTS